MEIAYLNTADKQSKSNFLYYLNSTYLGPFEYPNNELKSFVKHISSFQLIYNFRTLVPYQNFLNFECYHWTITQDYSFDQRAHFILNLVTKKRNCQDKNITNVSGFAVFIEKLLWIHVLVFILAFASFVLTWKYVYKIAKMYWRIKHQLQSEPALNYNNVNVEMDNINSNANDNNNPNNPNNNANANKTNNNNNENISILDKDGLIVRKTNTNNTNNNNNTNNLKEVINTNIQSKWDQLNIKEKGRFFNKWSIICLVGNLIQIFGSFISLLDYNDITTSSEMLIGFGCMFAYINIGRYLDYNRDYSTIYATISRALPNVLRYLLGVLPIFFGFIFFGLCLFWRSERFTSTSSTMMTLFAVLNGDSVFDVFNDLAGVNFFLGQIYCYCFCIVFIV